MAELFTTVAVGYVKVGTDRIEMDPDQRVRDAIALVFRKFAEFGSGRQVHLWFRQEGIDLPAVQHGAQGREVIWKPAGLQLHQEDAGQSGLRWRLRVGT